MYQSILCWSESKNCFQLGRQMNVKTVSVYSFFEVIGTLRNNRKSCALDTSQNVCHRTEVWSIILSVIAYSSDVSVMLYLTGSFGVVWDIQKKWIRGEKPTTFWKKAYFAFQQHWLAFWEISAQSDWRGLMVSLFSSLDHFGISEGLCTIWSPFDLKK